MSEENFDEKIDEEIKEQLDKGLERKGKKNWFVKMIKGHQIITLTFGFFFFCRFSVLLITYFSSKSLFLEKYALNIWFWLVGLPIVYFLQWLLVVWIASRFSKEKLQQKFLRHPIATIILFIMYVYDLPYRLERYGGKIIDSFETIVFYAFLYFFYWIFVCWISDKIFKKERFQWRWYKKIIEKIFVITPVVYKIILGLIIAIIIFFILFLLFISAFKYSGQDLKTLFY